MPPKSANLYCVCCHAKTPNAGVLKRKVTKNGRNMVQTRCAKCNTVKSQFTK